MKRLAAIDVGTNTALLLIAECASDHALRPLYQQEEIVRLGEGVDARKRIQPAALTRLATVLRRYHGIIERYRVERTVISGTSAVRDAENRAEVAELVRQVLDVRLRVLSGREEAVLTFRGALSNKSHLRGRIALVDIGGGSTEVVFGTSTDVLRATSLDIGSVRLTERFIGHDPVTDAEAIRILQAVRAHLQKALPQPDPVDHFVGVAGTVTTLAAMQQKLEPYDPEKVDGAGLTVEQVQELARELKRRPVRERAELPGLRPERADVIYAGALILLEIMRHYGQERVVVSDRGLRYGLLLESVSGGKGTNLTEATSLD